MQYVTYSDLFTFVLIIIALLTYLNNRDNKRKKPANKSQDFFAGFYHFNIMAAFSRQIDRVKPA